MREAARVILLLVAAVLAIQAARRLTASPTTYINSTHSLAIDLAASYNARSDPKVEEYLKQVEAGAELDVQRLGDLLKPSAEKAGKLVDLQRRLAAMAAGTPTPPPPEPVKLPPPKVAARPAARESAPPPKRPEPQPEEEPSLYSREMGIVERPSNVWQEAFGLGSGNFDLTNQQRLGIPNPRGFSVLVRAGQQDWQAYRYPVPQVAAFTVYVAGRIRPPATADPELNGATLLVPSAPRFSVLFRYCDAGGCSEPQSVAPDGGTVCYGGRGTPQFWYNDFSRTAAGEPLSPRLSHGRNRGEYAIAVVRADGAGGCPQ